MPYTTAGKDTSVSIVDGTVGPAVGTLVWTTVRPPSNWAAMDLALDNLYMTPFWVRDTTTIHEWRLQVNTAAVGAVGRLCIVNEDAATGRPSTLNVELGTISAAATGMVSLLNTQTLDPGRYFFGVACQGAAWSAYADTSPTGVLPLLWATTPNANEHTEGHSHYVKSGVAGAIPADVSALTGTGIRFPRTYVRVG